jgi:hypothetical protein
LPGFGTAFEYLFLRRGEFFPVCRQESLSRELLCLREIYYAHPVTTFRAGLTGQVAYPALAFSLGEIATVGAASENYPGLGPLGAVSDSS